MMLGKFDSHTLVMLCVMRQESNWKRKMMETNKCYLLKLRNYLITMKWPDKLYWEEVMLKEIEAIEKNGT